MNRFFFAHECLGMFSYSHRRESFIFRRIMIHSWFKGNWPNTSFGASGTYLPTFITVSWNTLFRWGLVTRVVSRRALPRPNRGTPSLYIESSSSSFIPSKCHATTRIPNLKLVTKHLRGICQSVSPYSYLRRVVVPKLRSASPSPVRLTASF